MLFYVFREAGKEQFYFLEKDIFRKNPKEVKTIMGKRDCLKVGISIPLWEP
jgi:hypothetical protein